MRITIEPTHEGITGPHQNPTVTVMLNGDDWSLDDIMEDMIEPALKAWRFPDPDSVLIKYYSQS